MYFPHSTKLEYFSLFLTIFMYRITIIMEIQTSFDEYSLVFRSTKWYVLLNHFQKQPYYWILS